MLSVEYFNKSILQLVPKCWVSIDLQSPDSQVFADTTSAQDGVDHYSKSLLAVAHTFAWWHFFIWFDIFIVECSNSSKSSYDTTVYWMSHKMPAAVWVLLWAVCEFIRVKSGFVAITASWLLLLYCRREILICSLLFWAGNQNKLCLFCVQCLMMQFKHHR